VAAKPCAFGNGKAVRQLVEDLLDEALLVDLLELRLLLHTCRDQHAHQDARRNLVERLSH
jgi:hypothetical protein